jgi:hypothetical protein
MKTHRNRTLGLPGGCGKTRSPEERGLQGLKATLIPQALRGPFDKLRAGSRRTALPRWYIHLLVFRNLLGTLLLFCWALRAQEKCPGEIKVLLPPPTMEKVIATLAFEQKAIGRVYLFDTDALDLLKQGVIVRARQGGNNDLTVKVRLPARTKEIDASHLREHFPCELDRTADTEEISFSVGRKYKPGQVPEAGSDLLKVFSKSQRRLLQEAGVSIDWTRVKSLANIKLTKWEAEGGPLFRKFALELWESPRGNVLELSTRVKPGAGASKYTELQRLLDQKGLPLSDRQGTKTSIVLEDVHAASPL